MLHVLTTKEKVKCQFETSKYTPCSLQYCFMISSLISKILFFLILIAGDAKQGHPLTRTGSDRRPDALREEPSKTVDSQNHNQENEDDVTTTER